MAGLGITFKLKSDTKSCVVVLFVLIVNVLSTSKSTVWTIVLPSDNLTVILYFPLKPRCVASPKADVFTLLSVHHFVKTWSMNAVPLGLSVQS